MLIIFSTPVLIRHLWKLKTVVFLHWRLICTVLLLKNHPVWPPCAKLGNPKQQLKIIRLCEIQKQTKVVLTQAKKH